MKNDSIKIIFKDKRWWLMLACTLAVIILGFKLASLKSYAADYPVASFYAGGFPENYHPYYINGEQTVTFDLPYGTIFFLIRTNTGTKCLYVSINSYLVLHKYSNGLMSIQQVNFPHSVDVDGVKWYYDYEDAPSQIVYHDYFPLPYQYDLDAVVRNVAVGITRYYKMLGGNLANNNVNIDTSNLEQLISDGNTIASNNATNVATITSDVNDIKQKGLSSSGIDEDTKLLFKRYDLWLVLIFFCTGLTMFRNVLHQFSKNVRMKK